MELSYVVFYTPWGWMGLLKSGVGLRRLVLPQPTQKAARRLLGRGGREDALAFGDLPQRLGRYLEGERVALDDPLDVEGATPFQKRVWQEARSIPRGETRSYAWLAERLGQPRAARAVGQALAANPIPIIIPCHRVVGKRGLGGYRGGLKLKEYLLKMERAKG